MNNMNRVLIFLLMIFLTGISVMCSSKKAPEHQPESVADTIHESSAAMDSFHQLMAETFHPFKDSGDLRPIKQHAAELAMAAAHWADAPLPEKLKNENVKAKLEKLKIDSQSLAALAKTGNNEEIGTALVKLHDLFHELHNIWSSKPEDEEGHRM